MGVFDIMILRKTPDGWPVLVQESHSFDPLPVRTDGMLRLDEVELAAQSSALAYGTVLGQALFRDQIAEALIRARARSPERLHVTLTLEDPHLRSFHWERLCARVDQSWRFLGLDQRTPFSLNVAAQVDRVYSPAPRSSQRALVLIASPSNLGDYNLAPFDPRSAAQTMHEALAGVDCDLLASDVQGAVGPPTLDALCQRLTAQVYTILHIVAHAATVARTGETVLYLGSAAGTVDAVPAAEFIQRLGRLGGGVGLPHLVFFACCDTATPDAAGSAGGLGLRLAQELGTPAVVAMTDKVSVATVEAMMRPFFRRLEAHGLVDLALSEACSQMAERADLTVPVLYSRLREKPLFQAEADVAPGAAAEGLPLVAAIDPRTPTTTLPPARSRTALRVLALVGLGGALGFLLLSSTQSAPDDPDHRPTGAQRFVAMLSGMQLEVGYPPNYLRSLVAAHSAALSDCFNGKDHDLIVMGRRWFTIGVRGDGTVVDAGPSKAGANTTELDACISAAFRAMHFGATPSGKGGMMRLALTVTEAPDAVLEER